jgi:hypothetical protein
MTNDENGKAQFHSKHHLFHKNGGEQYELLLLPMKGNQAMRFLVRKRSIDNHRVG